MNNFIQAILNVILPTRWWASYRRYVKKITTSGYMPDRSPFAWYLATQITKLWCFIQIGKVTIVNRHYLDAEGPMLVCANHGSMLDAQLSFPAFTRPPYFVGAFETMLACFGLVGVVMTRLGVIPVDRAQGHTVVESAVKVVEAGKVLALMPEGKISPSGELLPFKHGPAVIALMAYERLEGKQDVLIVPAHFCYHKRDTASALNYLKMGLRWRGGATITFLPPIKLSELEDRSQENIMCLLRTAIASVSCPTTKDPQPCKT